MNEQRAKLFVGFITYSEKAAAYLPYFLDSLFKQDYTAFEVLALDGNDQGSKSNLAILAKYPRIKLISQGVNFGFGKSFNLMIKEAQKKGAEYFLVLNPDMIMEADFVEKLVSALENNGRLGSASPKIYKWNFIPDKLNEKTNIIDSFGIKLEKGLRFFDAGQGEIDCGQFDTAKIIGPSGAAAMYRISALEKIKFDGQYFDERMFMYKEDCDLAYRLFLAGYQSRLVPEAKIYHDRTARGQGKSKIAIALNRKNKSRQIKQWSLFNQLIIIKKYWHLQNLANKFFIMQELAIMFIFSLIFEQYLLKEFFKIFRLKAEQQDK